MNIDELERITGITFTAYQKRILTVLLDGFDENVQQVWEWLQTNEAREFFYKQEGLLTDYYRKSGVNKKLDNIIHKRAKKGVDIISELYKYIREYGKEYNVTENSITYSSAERIAMNSLADNTYELIKNMNEDQIKDIRRQLLEDYINGRHPNKTSLENLKLQPINKLSSVERAKLIALTETARAINTGNLMAFVEQEIEFVELYGRKDKNGSEPCSECKEWIDKGPIPITEALKHVIIHPRCRCTWQPAKNPETNVYQKIS